MHRVAQSTLYAIVLMVGAMHRAAQSTLFAVVLKVGAGLVASIKAGARPLNLLTTE